MNIIDFKSFMSIIVSEINNLGGANMKNVAIDVNKKADSIEFLCDTRKLDEVSVATVKGVIIGLISSHTKKESNNEQR